MKRWLEKRSQKQQERLLLRLKTDPFLFLEIKDPTEEMKLALVRCHGRYLDFVKHPSERVCFEAVRTFPKAIQEANNHCLFRSCETGMDDGHLYPRHVNEPRSRRIVVRSLSERSLCNPSIKRYGFSVSFNA